MADTDLESFRLEARAWLDENVPASLRGLDAAAAQAAVGGAAQLTGDQQAWKSRMGEKGWGTPTWPTRYGGGGLSAAQGRVLAGEMARIGEDVSKRLDVIPAQFRVLVTRRPKYACRRCSQTVAQAHAPEHVVPGGLPTERFIAWIIVSKFGDHLPFYRQAEIFKRQGIDLDRGTLGSWVGRACCHLTPVIAHMRAHLRGADRIFVDETRARVLDPGRKATKSGYFWAVVSDDRAHGGAGPPIVLFHHAPGRGKEHPLKVLGGYRGRLPRNATPTSPTPP